MQKNIIPIKEKWKSTMTDRQRFINQVHFKPVDRCFSMEFGYWDEVFSQWELFRKYEVKNREEAFVLFGFDRIENLFGETFMLPPFEEKVIEHCESTLIIQNMDGLTAEVLKDAQALSRVF